MAIDTTNLQAAITAKIAGEDSAVTQSELLQYLAAADRYGVAQYYTSSASLPTADSAMEGSLVLVYTGQADSGNGLYLCTGTEWYEVQDLDSSSAPSYSFQGSNFGYTSGGASPTSNVIDKFPFTSDANATDVGDLLEVNSPIGGGQSSSTHGYTTGGYNGGYLNRIQKFSFSVDENATDVGDLTVARSRVAGQSSSENGYTSGGLLPPQTNVIDKFPFASDDNATDVGDLTVAKQGAAGQSSTENGYASGGLVPTISNVIDKFPFASDANATDVGDLTVARGILTGQSSTDNGYSSGGYTGPPAPSPFSYRLEIDKFPFASDGNATDVGDLTVRRRGSAGTSSTTNGYTAGGYNSPPGTYHNIIDKFPFSSDANATDVGDLTVARDEAAGQQY
jgi:hypothetical protein